MRLVLLQDHLALRQAFATLLESAGHDIVSGTGRVANARAVVRASEIDSLIVDVGMRDDPLELIGELARACPDVRIVIYAGTDDSTRIEAAMMAGAHGVISKEAPAEELLDALAAIERGQPWLDRRLEPLALDAAAHEPLLTLREREVLELLAAGMSGSEVARHLVVGPETVRSHVKSAMQRLNASTRTHAVVLALEHAEIQVRSLSDL